MLRRLLLALADDDSSRAAGAACLQIARQFHSAVTSVAPVDLHATTMMIGSGWGASYYGYQAIHQLEKRLVDHAKSLTNDFDASAKDARVETESKLATGVPWRNIAELANYHDLLVLGREAHFQSSLQENQKSPGQSVEKLLGASAAPLLCVSKAPLGEQNVLVGIDGKAPSARAFQRYLQLGLAADARVTVCWCRKDEDDEVDLESVEHYLKAHQREYRIETLPGDPKEEIPRMIQACKADLLVMGAHGRNRLLEWVFGSTTTKMLSEFELPLWISP